MSVESILNYGGVKEFSQDSVLFLEGEIGYEMYIILKGKVGIFINTLDDFPIKISEVETGGFFGEMCLIDHNPRSATAIAETDCSLVSINKTNFNKFVQAQPDMAYRIMKALSMRVRKLNDDMIKLKREMIKLSGESVGEDLEAKKNLKLISEFILSSSIFPRGHKQYNKKVEAVHYNYLVEKAFKCPVCEKNFKIEIPRIAKLIFEKTGKDLRTNYVDFDMILYSVMVCPSCNHARLYNDAYQLTDPERANMIVKSYLTKGKPFSGYSAIRTYDEIFEAYYIALYNYNLVKSTTPLTYAKLWMNLSWLYQDCNDQEMYKATSLHALEYYEEAYRLNKHAMTPREDQQFNLILGELKLVANRPMDAFKHFMYIISMETPSDFQIYKYAEEELETLYNKGIRSV